MARPKNGCLSILACAGAGSDPSAGSEGDADEHPDENKAISDKSRWSFRRRSTRHRVLKNSDISEPQTLSSSKAKSDITPSSNVYSSTYSYDSEKPLHQGKPDEKTLHQEKPEEKPLCQDKSEEKMMKPIEDPVDKPMEEPADQIIEKSIEPSAEIPTEEVAEKLTDTPIEEPAEKVTEAKTEDRAELTFGSPIEETPENTAGELIEKPNESSSVTSTEVEEPASLVEESSADPEEDHLESAAVVIQSGIRTFIARQELLNQKDLVKLQAVIRGHLVRRQASASLQCLLAIVKMQGLIRAHQARQYAGKFQEVAVHSSSEKLLCNAFALKLMDHLLSSKPIHVKCDPSESDDTWKWLERWTALIPPITRVDLPENSMSVGEKVQDNSQHDDKVVPFDSSENNVPVGEKVQENAQHDDEVIPLDDISFPKLVPDDVKETLETSDSSALEAPAFNQDERPEVEIKDDAELEFVGDANVHTEHVTNQETENGEGESLESLDQQATEADASKELSPLPEKPESCSEVISESCNTEEIPELEGKRLPRKSCNPAFAAAQLKFEELSTNSTIGKSGSSSYLDGASKPKVYISPSQEDYPSKQDNDTSVPESSTGHDTKTVVAASECGTEISISSTLDSPDRSEGDGGEIVMEIGALENRKYATDNGDKDTNTTYSEVKIAPEVEAQLQKDVQQNGHVSDAGVATDPGLIQETHVKLEKSDSLVKPLESYATPEGTPMSRATIAESHGTPSSDVSVNTKKSKSTKSRSHTSKRSLATPNRDSVGRSSTDSFSKDSRHAKRENSSKVAKSDHVDQEPRISNSNPLPSYMQFTESARAKASANISPKMSPDVQDSHPRKRHSLPMTNGKQDSSPRMQRSSSQAQQNVKSNGTVPHGSSDKRWHI